MINFYCGGPKLVSIGAASDGTMSREEEKLFLLLTLLNLKMRRLWKKNAKIILNRNDQ